MHHTIPNTNSGYAHPCLFTRLYWQYFTNNTTNNPYFFQVFRQWFAGEFFLFRKIEGDQSVAASTLPMNKTSQSLCIRFVQAP
jgi:hypothetical protein